MQNDMLRKSRFFNISNEERNLWLIGKNRPYAEYEMQ